MENIFLSKQKVFDWQKRNEIFFAGYFYDETNNFYHSETAAEKLKDVKSLPGLKQFLNNTNGVYSIVLKNNKKIILATSHMRYFPLYYTKQNGKWLISDCCDKLSEMTGKRELSEISKLEFLKQGFVSHNRTLYKDILNVQSGELVILNEDLESEFHYFHPTNNFYKNNAQILSGQLTEVINNVGKRLVNSLKNKTAVIPLSGGYDSRLIVCMLKNAGLKDVICFTYGKNNPESEISKKVAKKLGYKWYFVDYTKIRDVENIFNTNEFLDYSKYAANAVSMPFMQEYPAIKYLHDKKLIPPDSVIIPGHAGGFIAGSFLGYKIFKDQGFKGLDEKIFQTNYSFAKISKSEKHIILNYINKQISDFIRKDKPVKPYTIFEGITQMERMTKFILNSSRVFDYFGYETRFPFWDYEIENFFRQIPYELRVNKKLFKSVVENSYFKPAGIHFSKELQATPFDYLKQNIKKPFKKFIPHFIKKRLIKKNDWMCYDEFTSALQYQLKSMSKNTLNSYYEYNAIICYWFIKKHYE